LCGSPGPRPPVLADRWFTNPSHTLADKPPAARQAPFDCDCGCGPGSEIRGGLYWPDPRGSSRGATAHVSDAELPYYWDTCSPSCRWVNPGRELRVCTIRERPARPVSALPSWHSRDRTYIEGFARDTVLFVSGDRDFLDSVCHAHGTTSRMDDIFDRISGALGWNGCRCLV